LTAILNLLTIDIVFTHLSFKKELDYIFIIVFIVGCR